MIGVVRQHGELAPHSKEMAPRMWPLLGLMVNPTAVNSPSAIFPFLIRPPKLLHPKILPGLLCLHMLEVNFGFAVSTSGLNTTEPFRDGGAMCRGVEAGDCGVLVTLVDRLEPKGTCCREAA